MRLTDVMERLARGDSTVQVSDADRRDEVGMMARVVKVFKDNAVKMLRSVQDARSKPRNLVPKSTFLRTVRVA